MILTIARKELKALFSAPLAWVVLTLIQLTVGYGFLQRINDYVQIQSQLIDVPNPPGITEAVAVPVYATVAMLMLFAVPLLAMRLIAEERRQQTMTLLLSAPISMLQLVLGKFLGLWLFLLIILALTTLMPLSLLAGGHLDFGLLCVILLGTILLAASFSAVGLYASSLTTHPIVAALVAFGLLIGMLLVGETAADGFQAHGWAVPSALAQVLSPLKSFDPFTRGLFDSHAVVCFLLLTGVFLALAIRRLDSVRLGA